jgi:hypothetical protein
MPDSYQLKDVERRLAEDERTHELGIHLQARGERLFVEGPVSSERARSAVLEIVREECPGCEVVDEMVADEEGLGTAPGTAEEIR